MEDFEKLGAFYLGRPYDLKNKQRRDGLVLYDSKDLVTHAVCVGMTGSGKTGLCIGLLEEAAIDGVPAIVIDFPFSRLRPAPKRNPPARDFSWKCICFPSISMKLKSRS
jgi:hypothetical protein